uniref:Integrin alpha-2 domain-containing protein n=1 Tax=Astatotilapia calliptera TaxID=8154 RepID=A0AAX7T1Z8_ASTCA
MGTVPGLSPTRSWGKCCECAVLALPVVVLWFQLGAAFNLDTENRVVFTGPPGSYFGYSVEFFKNSSSINILIGAPKANTSQPNVTEGGAVYMCPWSQNNCTIISFDKQGRCCECSLISVEFKSHQWFGATVRAHGSSVLACAPRYYWRTEHDIPFSDVTGTCYLAVDNLKRFVEFAPCRTERHGPAGQGYCQGGFSADFTKVREMFASFMQEHGQLISATTEEIVKAYYPAYFLLSVAGQIQTRQVQGSYDDSYLGKEAPLPFPMGSYFGYAVATTDINSDGLDDLVVGAPLFMHRGSNGRLEELGKVYVYLQRGPLELEPSQSHLLGLQAFSRFGTSLAPLGDLNQDGFNDVAIGCPYGGDDQQGSVFIYNGHVGGLKDTPTQMLSGQWAFSSFPASFGFTVRGNRDLDQNGYPDLIVGAFGVDKAVLYRARPIVNASASLTVQPTMFNQEEKHCMLTTGNKSFVAEVQLDSGKQKQKESIRRTLFLDSQQPSLVKTFNLTNRKPLCHNSNIYLRPEEEFRDKLSPIYISLNFSLDPQAPLDQHGLRPILNYETEQLIKQKAQIQLDCGDDNICVPDLKLAVYGDKTEVYLGGENSVSLTFNARNEGEGGAYEAELYVALPPEADYSGIARNNLTCSYEAENQTRYLVCDLGNPMKSGTSLWAGLRFTIPRLSDTYNTVQFELQIRSKNANNSESEVVFYELKVSAMADIILQGVSRPDKVIFPPPNWTVRQGLGEEQEIGPELQQVFEVKITSTIHKKLVLSRFFLIKLLFIDRPQRAYKQYTLECSVHFSVDRMPYSVSPTLKPSGSKKVATAVMWNKPNSQYSVPVWIIILAVLAGLLLLALLIYLLYKMGFFKRSDPYGTTMEKAKLKPQASSEA